MTSVPLNGGAHESASDPGPSTVLGSPFPPEPGTVAADYAERVRQCVALLTEQIDDLLTLLLLSVAPESDVEVPR